MGSRGISNYQIENAVANIGHDNLTNNFVGVFSFDHARHDERKRR